MLELVRVRRSIRSFTDQPLSAAQISQLAETLLRAPSSRNINPWEFILVDDRQLLVQLSAAKRHGSGFLAGAALGVVICADETKSDVWVEDCSIAAILLQMTAQSLGLGSCWAQIRKRPHDSQATAEEFVQQVLGLPKHIRVASIIGIGHSAEKRRPLAADQLQHDKLRYNNYSTLLNPAGMGDQ